jgi:SAM-dependent methyltransferase
LLRRYLGAEDRVLDVGCANGIFLRLVAPECAHAVGVDINERMLGLARAKLEEDGIANAGLVSGSATALPFADGEFDLVYSFSTLLLVPDVGRALGEISRILRPGGTAILDFTGRFNLSQRHWRRWYRKQGHFGLNAYSLRGARRALAGVELDPVEIRGLGLSDQWRYVRGLNRAQRFDRVFHRGEPGADLDARLSGLPLLRGLANRWYIVARKRLPDPS